LGYLDDLDEGRTAFLYQLPQVGDLQPITDIVTLHDRTNDHCVYSVYALLSTWERSGKEGQLRKLQERFVQDVNKFNFFTDVVALEGIGEDGAGELLEGRSDVAKAMVRSLFIPLQPPHPEAPWVLQGQ
jgi:hypothetical protein